MQNDDTRADAPSTYSMRLIATYSWNFKWFLRAKGRKKKRCWRTDLNCSANICETRVQHDGDTRTDAWSMFAPDPITFVKIFVTIPMRVPTYDTCSGAIETSQKKID